MSSEDFNSLPALPITAAPSGLRARMLKSMGWSFFGTVASRGLSLAASIIIARVIGKEEFGELAVIQSSILLFAMFAGFGLSYTATRSIAEFRVTDKARAGRVLRLVGAVSFISCTVAAVAMFFASSWLAGTIFNAPRLTDLMRVASLVLLFETLNAQQVGVLSGFEAFKTTARTNTISAVLQVTMQMIGVFTAGLIGAIWALVFARLFTWLLNRWFIRQEADLAGIRIGEKQYLREWPLLLKYGLPSLISGLLASPFMWVTNALLVNQPGGFSEMGIFRATHYYFIIFVLIGQTLSAPMLPIIVSLSGVDRKRAEKASIIITWAIGLLPTLPLILFPELIMGLYGADYAGRTFLTSFSIVMLYSCVYLFNLGLGIIGLANDMNWRNAFGNFVWGLSHVTSFLFLKQYGAVGLAISYLIAYILSGSVQLIFNARESLIPSGTILSLRSLGIWMILAISFVTGIFVEQPWLKFLVLCAALAGISVIVFAMYKTVKSGHSA